MELSRKEHLEMPRHSMEESVHENWQRISSDSMRETVEFKRSLSADSFNSRMSGAAISSAERESHDLLFPDKMSGSASGLLM